MNEEEFRRAGPPYTHTFSFEWAPPRGSWDVRRRLAAWRRKRSVRHWERSVRHWVEMPPQVLQVTATGDRPPLQEPDGGRRGD